MPKSSIASLRKRLDEIEVQAAAIMSTGWKVIPAIKYKDAPMKVEIKNKVNKLIDNMANNDRLYIIGCGVWFKDSKGRVVQMSDGGEFSLMNSTKGKPKQRHNKAGHSKRSVKGSIDTMVSNNDRLTYVIRKKSNDMKKEETPEERMRRIADAIANDFQ